MSADNCVNRRIPDADCEDTVEDRVVGLTAPMIIW